MGLSPLRELEVGSFGENLKIEFILKPLTDREPITFSNVFHLIFLMRVGSLKFSLIRGDRLHLGRCDSRRMTSDSLESM